MTGKQLLKIKKLAKPFYKKTGKYHNWEHIQRVEKNALFLADKSKEIDFNILKASCYLHDIGRTRSDEKHVEESIGIAKNLLEKTGVSRKDTEKVLHAIKSHDIKDIKEAKTIEAKILFDADKLEIATVYGFFRTLCWLVDERGMKVEDAVVFLWKNIKDAKKNDLVQTPKARKIFLKEFEKINFIVKNFKV